MKKYGYPFTMFIYTEGVRGGSFETADGITHRWEPAPVTPGGDSYGAGDSFAAGLTFALGQGREPADAVRFAARCGAACASGRAQAPEDVPAVRSVRERSSVAPGPELGHEAQSVVEAGWALPNFRIGDDSHEAAAAEL